MWDSWLKVACNGGYSQPQVERFHPKCALNWSFKQVVKGVSKGFVTVSTGVSSFKRMLLDYSWSCAGMRALVVPCVILTRRSATFTTWIMSLCPGLINPLQLKFYNLSRQFQIYCYYDNIIYIYSINHIYIYIYYKCIVYIYCILYMYYRCILYICIC